jgi:uncharacterized membrane protein
VNTAPHLQPHPASVLSWPQARAGVIAAWLGLLSVVMLVANFFTATDGSQAGLIMLESLLMIVASPISLVAALIAMVRHHERSLFLWIPVLVGALFLAFVGVEIFVGHE